MTKPTVDLADTIASWRTKTNTISDNVGDPSLLTTSTDSSTVSAINELVGRIDNVDSDIGTLASLNTTDRSSLVSAVNELDRRIPDVYDNTGTLLNT